MSISTTVLEVVKQPSARPIPDSIQAAGRYLVQKYGQSVQGVLLYGSCLRTGSDENGLVDCYVIVDKYASVYSSKWVSLLNHWLPPNVFYGEVDFRGRKVRMKYAILSLKDFERSVTHKRFHSYFWGRFAQPTTVMFSVNPDMNQRIIRGLGQAVVTFLAHALPQMASPFSAKDLWRQGLTLSYRAELRTESGRRIQVLWDHDYMYYEKLTQAALPFHFPHVRIFEEADQMLYEVDQTTWTRAKNRAGWLLRSVQGKALSVMRLLKAAFTFQGGADYLVWKIERHSGVKIQLTPAQRRHPIWAGLTTFWRLYRHGAFR